MSEGIELEVITPELLVGSATCTTTVRITNNSTKNLDRVSVEPVVLCGKLLLPESSTEESSTSELFSFRRRIISEMERQVVLAYERDRIRNLSASEKAAYLYVSVINMYASIFTGGTSRSGLPTWAREAFRIQEWEDVERLEADLMSKERETSILRKAFEINKGKLRRCLNRIASENQKQQEQQHEQKLNPGDELPPGASITYPFTLRLPHLTKAKELNLEFQATYRDTENDQFTKRSVGKCANIRPSAFAVPTGGIVGAACGYGIRTTLNNSAAGGIAFDWWAFGGSILLGLVFTYVTARKPHGKQPIAVEDLVGGFIIGALTGLFSEEVLDKLALLMR